MSPTPITLKLFWSIVFIGTAAVIYFSRTGPRYLLWASAVALLLGISAVRSSGEVVFRKESPAEQDSLVRALDGPHGLRIRIGLVILLALLVLLGFGVLEPGTLSKVLLQVRDAA